MQFQIAGLTLHLYDCDRVLSELEGIYREFDARGRDYARDVSNPHLCFAGCSHCCRRGAFFAVTLVEAVRWTRAVVGLSEELRSNVQTEAERLMALQETEFSGEPRVVPGQRDEGVFRSRVAQVARQGPGCPLLHADMCSVYEGRPFLCRAYGFPVDTYAVETARALTFRSLCHLYEGHELLSYIRGMDLRQRLDELSARLTRGREVGRFTSAEALLARFVSGA